MQRDILRDGILISFLCFFIYQVFLATQRVLAKEKAVKTRRVSSEALEFPVVTACPLYCYELGMCNTTIGVASLDEQFASLLIPDKNGNRSYYNINSTNLNQIVDTKVIPGIHGTPHSCVRITPMGPVQPGLSNQVQLYLKTSHINLWYITLHDKNQMVGFVSNLFGSTFSYVTSPNTNSTVARVVTSQVIFASTTMLNDEDFWCDDSENEVNLELCLEHYIESVVGCHSPYKSYKLNNSSPLCVPAQMVYWITEFKILESMGEQAIYEKTGCLSNCRRREYSINKMGETDLVTSSESRILLQLYFPSTMYDERKQYLIYDENHFIADFGGYLGLLLGSSLLSLYDKVKRWLKALHKLISEKLLRKYGRDQVES